MKTKNLLVLFALALLTVFTSCKKDDNSLKFSPLTVEENKANIENNGMAMLDAIKLMETNPAIDDATNMMNYIMNYGDIFGANPNFSGNKKVGLFNDLLKPVMIASNLKKFNPKQVANELKVNFEPSTLTEAWNTIKGTYTWNSGTETWNWVTGSSLIIRFPSTEIGTTNNVEFKVYDVLFETGPFSWANNAGDLPAQIKCNLKVDGATRLTYLLNVTYLSADKKPNSISTSLELLPFKFAFDATNTNDASASVSFKWTNASTTLVELSLSATGDWSADNLSNFTPGDVFNNGNASFQLMNIKIVGNVDVKNLNAELNAIDPSLTSEQSAIKECEIISKYASLYVCYADDNLIIAKVIVYPFNNGDYWEVTPKFQFADESSVDMKTYFGSGFSELQTALEDYLNVLRTNYGI